MKRTVVLMVLGASIVIGYLSLWVMGGARMGFMPGWWTLFILPHYVFTVLLIVGLALLGYGTVQYLRARR